LQWYFAGVPPRDLVADELAAEARYLHAALFRRPPAATVVERYIQAHRLLFADHAASPLVSRIVEERLDAEAIEYALRLRASGRQLTRKLQILCYLAESLSAYQDEFVNRKNRRSVALFTLAGSGLRSAWKRVKGELLVRRHGLL
jgi:hypothetical protein